MIFSVARDPSSFSSPSFNPPTEAPPSRLSFPRSYVSLKPSLPQPSFFDKCKLRDLSLHKSTKTTFDPTKPPPPPSRNKANADSSRHPYLPSSLQPPVSSEPPNPTQPTFLQPPKHPNLHPSSVKSEPPFETPIRIDPPALETPLPHLAFTRPTKPKSHVSTAAATRFPYLLQLLRSQSSHSFAHPLLHYPHRRSPARLHEQRSSRRRRPSPTRRSCPTRRSSARSRIQGQDGQVEEESQHG
ncbi:hypothetical protein BDY24DRAFT_195013 [Mrakia frigida]|uniref:uncharacterized protein n=1 Tax=Mrakia frigida TaxID=29902 RepID=UPI003FCC15E5